MPLEIVEDFIVLCCSPSQYKHIVSAVVDASPVDKGEEYIEWSVT